MDLRSYSPTVEQVEKARTLLNYQPFTVSDTSRTGAAHQWMYPERSASLAYRGETVNPLVANKDEMPQADWGNFIDATLRQQKMYDDWIDAICGFIPDLSGLTMVDVACNNGYFPVSFSLRGVKEAHGYDMTDFGEGVDLLNSITGSNAIFHHASYDSMRHTIDGIGQHDIVIASAIMEHISDPLYFLNFVSGICKKLLFLFLPTIDTKELAITFNETKSRHDEGAKFPVCFDSVKLSAPLIYRSLALCGFKNVVELHHRETWVPLSFYKSRRVFIALR